MIEKICVTVVINNSVAESSLWAEHGLSMLIEVESDRRRDKAELSSLSAQTKLMPFRHKILFDTGQSGELLLHNLKALEIDLSDLSTIVLSHGHYDHTGGLLDLLDHLSHPVRIIAHPAAWGSRKNKQPRIREIGTGLDPRSFAGFKAELIQAPEPLELVPCVWTTGHVPRLEALERSSSFLRQAGEGELVADDIDDDISLVADLGPKGLVLIAGCCHAGIVNTLGQARRLTGNDRIAGIIGGLHLIGASSERLERTIEVLRGANLGRLTALHCSGLAETCRLRQGLGEIVNFGTAGTKVCF